MFYYPIDLNLIIGSTSVLVDVTLAITFLIDLCLCLLCLAESAHEKNMHEYYYKKNHAPRPHCFVPAAAVFYKRIDSTVDTQRTLLATLIKIQARQIDATKLGL